MENRRKLDLLAPIAAWVETPVLAELVATFGGELDPGLDLRGRLDYLADFAERWDFRKGRERNLVESPEFEPAVEALIDRAAVSLNLKGNTVPPAGHYDHILVLGGLVRACLVRPLHARYLLGLEGGASITADSLIALGGHRPLGGNELNHSARFLGVDLEDEFAAMDLSVRRTFELSDADLVATDGAGREDGSPDWTVHDYRSQEGMPVRVAAAPSPDPTRRANTSDSYRWLAETGYLKPGQRLILITTDIYVPYQHAAAIRLLTLPYRVEVVPAGVRAGDYIPGLAYDFKPHSYLQEILSTIRAFRDLESAL